MTLGRFIALEGVDGVGKTTLAAQVAERLGSLWAIRFLRRQTVPKTPAVAQAAMGDLAKLLWQRGDCRDDHLLPAEFWLHLQAAWHAAANRHVITPQRQGGDAVILDGWYYKFFAKLLLRGFEPERLASVFAEAGEPDHVILLDRDPGEVWRRGIDFNQAEMGLHQGYTSLGEGSFVPYQRNVLARLRDLAALRQWHVLSLPLGASVDEDASRVAALVESFL